MSHTGVDLVLRASQVIVALNYIVSRNIDPADFMAVNSGFISSGAAPNVMPDTARLVCSIPTYTLDDAELAHLRAEEVIKGICTAYGRTWGHLNRCGIRHRVKNDPPWSRSPSTRPQSARRGYCLRRALLRQRGLRYVYKRHFGVFRFRQGRRRRRWPTQT